MYKLIENGVKNLDTGANIPECEENRDWQEYQAWLADGNTPQPKDDFSKEIQKDKLQTQIDNLERIAGVRTFREYMLKIGEVGVKTSKYPNGKTKDIDEQISALRAEIAGL